MDDFCDDLDFDINEIAESGTFNFGEPDFNLDDDP
jgi:hypothetical protein